MIATCLSAIHRGYPIGKRMGIPPRTSEYPPWRDAILREPAHANA